MEIKENRRAKLIEWFSARSIPPKEKSYISQLMGGVASFGERAARRLERDYGMGDGYLDGSQDAAIPSLAIDEDSDLNNEGRRQDMQWVCLDEAKLLTLYRCTDDRGRDHIMSTAESEPKIAHIGIRHQS